MPLLTWPPNVGVLYMFGRRILEDAHAGAAIVVGVP